MRTHIVDIKENDLEIDYVRAQLRQVTVHVPFFLLLFISFAFPKGYAIEDIAGLRDKAHSSEMRDLSEGRLL